jgi:soluble lytic murein transglycosylase-like protein
VVGATALRWASAAALSAALLVCAARPGQATCALVSAGPAYGQSWAERRQELIARNGFAQPATTLLLYATAAPAAPRGCADTVAGSAEVRHRLALIAPTWRRYGALIASAAARHGVPAELILAAIVEESGGRAQAIATYPGYVSDAATPSKVSLGLGQMLLSSAQALAPERRMSRAALFDPAIAIDLVARYFARFYRTTGFDPRLAGSSYNAGSVRAPPPGQRWAPPNPRYVARFVAVFEASVVHLATQPSRPAVSFAALMAVQ